MVQAAMFDNNGNATPEAQASGVAAACSAEAHGKVDISYLRQLVEEKYKHLPDGATADEVLYLARDYAPWANLDALSIRPRVSELKARGILVPTGERRENMKGNTCAVLVHRDYAKEAV